MHTWGTSRQSHFSLFSHGRIELSIERWWWTVWFVQFVDLKGNLPGVSQKRDRHFQCIWGIIMNAEKFLKQYSVLALLWNLKNDLSLSENFNYLVTLLAATVVDLIPTKLLWLPISPPPTSNKAVESFLSFCTYTIENFFHISWPLRRLTENMPPLWKSKDQHKEFYELRQCMQMPSRLALFDKDSPMITHRGANNVNFGAVLVQWHGGSKKVIT